LVYLIRHVETGRDAQSGRRKLQRDLVEWLRAELSDARIWTDTGRIVLATEHDARAALARLHGICSFSPCRPCALAALEPCVLEVAATALARARSYRLRIRRVGSHSFTSHQKAAALGAAIARRFPSLRVDLGAPEVTLGIEIRGDHCFVFDTVVPGWDKSAPRGRIPDGERRFLVDQMLGRLAAWLRLLGYDSVQLIDEADSALVRRAEAEGRILLTRDRALAAVRGVPVHLIEGQALADQLREVLAAFDLHPERARAFSRCSRCNRPVIAVSKEAVRAAIPATVYRRIDRFTACPGCGKVYWQGNHSDRIRALLDGLK
jgi:uncharacterized protein with PIN domain